MNETTKKNEVNVTEIHSEIQWLYYFLFYQL